MDGRLRVGTSGWSYEHWKDRFYPGNLPRRSWFAYYASHFSTVEINATFYGLPAATTVAKWREAAPQEFLYAAKGSRLITHSRQLLDCDAAVHTLWERLSRLEEHLAVILWQLPPGLERDDARLDRFLAGLPTGVRHAVEFRHPSWLADGVYTVLERHRAALVGVSSAGFPAARVATTDFVYVRFHGLGGGYAHDYSATELLPWVEWASQMAEEDRAGYFYFNNDALARAPANAAQFTAMLGDAALSWPR